MILESMWFALGLFVVILASFLRSVGLPGPPGGGGWAGVLFENVFFEIFGDFGASVSHCA